MKVQVLKSSEGVQDSASFGCTTPLASREVSVSKIAAAAVSAGRGIEHADLQRIETGDIEFEADGDAAARLLGVGGHSRQCHTKSRHKKYSRERARTDRRFH